MGLYVRKVKTASGATAVQITEKRRGVRTIVEHIGSGHTDAEVAALVQVAKDRIAGDQQELDLQIPLPADRPSPAAAPAGPVVTGPSRSCSGTYSRAPTRGSGSTPSATTPSNSWCWRGWWSRPPRPTPSGCSRSSGCRPRRCASFGGPWPPASSTTGGTPRAGPPTRSPRPRPGLPGCRSCSTTSLPCISRPMTMTSCARSGRAKERRVYPQIVVGLLVDSGRVPAGDPLL